MVDWDIKEPLHKDSMRSQKRKVWSSLWLLCFLSKALLSVKFKAFRFVFFFV